MVKLSNEKRGGLARCDFFYGHQININFAGRDNYGTNCGAIVSIILILCLSVFVLSEIKQLIFGYVGLERNKFLQETPITTVTTLD